MARILGIGIATLDIINTVDGYPPEDGEVRALAQRVCRGGNATNTLVVLAQLGHRCSWGGVLVEGPDGRRIVDDLSAHDVDTGFCRRLPSGAMPTSYVTLNRRNGSRTIVHYRDLPEFGFDDYRAIDLVGVDWLHCEGRNVEDTCRMLADAAVRHPDLRRSVEVEKPRPGVEALFGHAELLLFSRSYARASGYASAEALLRWARGRAPSADLVCSWGEAGAWALDRSDRLLHSPAFAPPRVIDTLGAGDTFNAGLIAGCLRGWSLERALQGACRLAGRKCGQAGLSGLDEL
ncbi:MAG: PfkB family carbohydrate kinase [Gammaproteobacteria bacterium]